jgi:hypothetical protein
VPRALDAHRAVTTHRPFAGRAPDGMGRPKAMNWAVRAGLWSSEPLWPWAAVRPNGIVKFFIFMDLFKYKSNLIQFELDFLQICSNSVWMDLIQGSGFKYENMR